MPKSKADLIDSLDDFTRAYIECALWSSHDTNSEDPYCDDPLDANYSAEDIALPTLREMIRECREFQKYQANDLLTAYETNGCNYSESSAGHDFWLTRNGHGAGFWDRGLGSVGERLYQASKPYDSVDLYVARGKVHSN